MAAVTPLLMSRCSPRSSIIVLGCMLLLLLAIALNNAPNSPVEAETPWLRLRKDGSSSGAIP